jgi:hypothetical protein
MITYEAAEVWDLPFDPASITGVRIDGSPGVTPVDSASARVVEAAGETWLHWRMNGVTHAVGLRHVAELLSAGAKPDVIDLREDDGELAHLLSPYRSGASV